MELFDSVLRLVMAGGALCILFGVVMMLTPQVIHKMNAGINQTIVSLDETFLKYNWISGITFLVLGLILVYVTI
jgi:uncharacterized protein YjeT (DUF2065 family)